MIEVNLAGWKRKSRSSGLGRFEQVHFGVSKLLSTFAFDSLLPFYHSLRYLSLYSFQPSTSHVFEVRHQSSTGNRTTDPTRSLFLSSIKFSLQDHSRLHFELSEHPFRSTTYRKFEMETTKRSSSELERRQAIQNGQYSVTSSRSTTRQGTRGHGEERRLSLHQRFQTSEPGQERRGEAAYHGLG